MRRGHAESTATRATPTSETPRATHRLRSRFFRLRRAREWLALPLGALVLLASPLACVQILGDFETGSSRGGSSVSSSGASGAAPAIPYCRQVCSTPDDCADEYPTLGADNHACTANRCEYLGCQSTAECTEEYESADYVCAPKKPGLLPDCYKKCNVPNDCATPGDPLKDEDNWACEGNLCQWKGCLSDEECEARAAGYVCTKPEGIGVSGENGLVVFPLPLAGSGCEKKCTTPQDCDPGGAPLYEPDNFACEEGLCRYVGCKSNDECVTFYEEFFGETDFVCE